MTIILVWVRECGGGMHRHLTCVRSWIQDTGFDATLEEVSLTHSTSKTQYQACIIFSEPLHPRYHQTPTELLRRKAESWKVVVFFHVLVHKPQGGSHNWFSATNRSTIILVFAWKHESSWEHMQTNILIAAIPSCLSHTPQCVFLCAFLLFVGSDIRRHGQWHAIIQFDNYIFI